MYSSNLSTNQKIKLNPQDQEVKVLRVSSSNTELLLRIPDNENGRNFIVSSLSGQFDLIISSFQEKLHYGLYIKSLSENTSYELLETEEVSDDQLIELSLTYSKIFRNLLNKIIIGDSYHVIETSLDLKIDKNEFFKLTLNKNKYLLNTSTIFATDEFVKIAEENNLIKKKETIDLDISHLKEMNNFLEEISSDYIALQKREESKEVQDVIKADNQNYIQAIENLDALFHKHKKTSVTLGNDPLELIKEMCLLSKINTDFFDKIDFSKNISLEELISEVGDIGGYRFRRISLKKDWRNQSHGNLLCINNSGEALIAYENSPAKYELSSGSEDRDFDNISIGYVFYKSLPDVVKPSSLFKYAIEGKTTDIVFVFVAAITGTILGFIPPIVIGELLNKAVPATDLSLAIEFAGLLFVVSFGVILFDLTKSICQVRLESIINSNLQSAVWDRVLRIKPQFFAKYNSGILLDKINGISSIRELLTGATTQAILDGLFGILHLSLMYFYSPELTAISLWIVLFIVVVTIVHRVLITKSVRGLIKTEGELQGFAAEIVTGINKVKVSGFQSALFRKFTGLYAKRTSFSHRVETIKDSQSAIQVLFQPISTLILYWVLVGAIFNPDAKSSITLGAYFAFSASFGILLSAVTELSAVITETLGDVDALLNHTKDVLEAPLENNSGEYAQFENPTISFKNVSFSYENSKNIISNLSFDIKAGETLALLGPTGSGKSTIANLILCFELPTSGTILISGFDISKVNVKSLRSSMSAVLQGTVPIAGNIYDFITGGIHIETDYLNNILDVVSLKNLTEKLPMGLHTIISENGSNFSLAENAKFILARGLITKPKLIILDEVLTKLSQEEVDKILSYLKANKITAIILGQEFNIAKLTDKLLVIEKGNSYFGNYNTVVKKSKFFKTLEQLSK